MFKIVRTAMCAASLVALSVPAFAQPFSEVVPTKKDPIRFSAFAVQMQHGLSGVIEVAIERWTTEEERSAIVGLVKKTTDKEADDRKH